MNSSRIVVCRVDSSTEIGSGHLTRCLTLARGLRGRGYEVIFISREHTGNLNRHIESEGFRVLRLSTHATAREYLSAYHRWLGTDPLTDAKETITAIGAAGITRPTWMVVDHYALDADWETRLRPAVDGLMAIDDLADRQHNCDVLLDQNLVADYRTRYAGKIPKEAQLLMGPSYALLQPVYAELRARLRPRTGAIGRILVYFGASDLPNMTGLVLKALSEPQFQNLAIDLVIGRSNPHRASLITLAEQSNGITVHEDLPSLAPLMVEADAAVGAGGATSWERLCLRLPAIVVTLADNQRAIAAELDRRGLIRWLGDAEDLGVGEVLAALRPLASGQKWKLPNEIEVDGYGTDRVLDALSHRDND